MSRIRGLELLFNLEKKNLKSKEDCVVAVFHCLLINEGVQCAGVGDEWPESISSTTELLPSDWNNNQNMYSLRYISTDAKSRILLKITKMEHILQVDVVMNENAVASMSLPVETYIDNYNEYSSAYKDLESLCNSFRKDVMEKLKPVEKKENVCSSSQSKRESTSSSIPFIPLKRPVDLREERDVYGVPRFPRVGGSDLNPFGGGGGMFMDPSSFGIPARPTLPQFGVGGLGGLPRGSVPPGARFDPFMPPIGPNRFGPDPDHFKPPGFDDDFI